MRRYAPLHEIDSPLDPAAALGETTQRIFSMPASANCFVQSNIDDEAALKAASDGHEPEQCKRAARRAGRKLQSMQQAVANWLNADDRTESDNYFADAAYLVDPQQRLHHIERIGMTRYLFTD